MFLLRNFVSTDSHSPYLGEVDHFFPFALYHATGAIFFKKVEEIWNHVLACTCNGASGKSSSLARKDFLQKPYIRNNYYVESHHPLRETIMAQTGTTEQKRQSFLQNFLHEAQGVITSSLGRQPRTCLMKSECPFCNLPKIASLDRVFCLTSSKTFTLSPNFISY